MTFQPSIDLTGVSRHATFDVRLRLARSDSDVTLYFYVDDDVILQVAMTQDQLWRLQRTINQRCVGILEPKEAEK